MKNSLFFITLALAATNVYSLAIVDSNVLNKPGTENDQDRLIEKDDITVPALSQLTKRSTGAANCSNASK